MVRTPSLIVSPQVSPDGVEPAVLLFDEPLSNLDARLRREMREEIRSLQQRLKLTVAYVTHDQSEALAVSDQIIVMENGTVIGSGTHSELVKTVPLYKELAKHQLLV